MSSGYGVSETCSECRGGRVVLAGHGVSEVGGSCGYGNAVVAGDGASEVFFTVCDGGEGMWLE